MIGSGQWLLSKEQCTALVQEVWLRLWEICFLTLVALLILGTTLDMWRPFALAGLVSLLSDMVIIPWQSLRQLVPTFLLRRVAGKRSKGEKPQLRFANSDTASDRRL